MLHFLKQYLHQIVFSVKLSTTFIRINFFFVIGAEIDNIKGGLRFSLKIFSAIHEIE